MSRSITKRAAFAAVSLSVASVAIAASPASAAVHQFDPTFTPNAASSTTPDFVGVGSDTSEGAMHYLAEGANGVPGFNAGKTEGRIASFAAKDEANPNITLRSGSTPIGRPNGSTPGKATLFTPNNNPDVSYARSSSALSTTEVANNLFAYPFAVDGLKLAVSRDVASHAPATITPAQMVSIYKGDIRNWSGVGGTDGVIKPLIPQAGSGTRSFFEAQLRAANGGTAVTLGSNVAETQEHSDAAIKNDADAVAPFSTGRAKGAAVKLVDGFVAQRALYNVLRQADTTKPAFRAIFGPNGFICSSDAEALIAAAGFEQLAPESKRGVCGVATQGATTNFKTTEQAAGVAATTTTVAAQGSPNGQVRLTVEVDPSNAAGTVTFYEVKEGLPDAQVGATEGVAVTDGEAVATLAGVSAGEHTYYAKFASADINEFADSTSENTTATVADDKYDGVLVVSNPITTWGNVKTVTATLKSGGNNATGAVKLNYGSSELSANLVNGVATFALPSTLAAGSQLSVVSYAGDSNFAKDFKLQQLVVSKATTKSTVKMAASRVKAGKATSATVTVVVNGTTQKANGTITLKIGSTTMGTAKVVNGTAKVTVKALSTISTKRVVGTFTSGSANYGSSTAPTVTYSVVK